MLLSVCSDLCVEWMKSLFFICVIRLGIWLRVFECVEGC